MISKFAAYVLVKKVHEMEKEESGEPSNQSNYVFIETINIQNSAFINQMKN